MDRSVAPVSGLGKPIVEAAISSISAGGVLLQEDLDECVGHRVRMAANDVDFLVGQLQRVVAEQLAAAPESNPFRNRIVFEWVVHWGFGRAVGYGFCPHLKVAAHVSAI